MLISCINVSSSNICPQYNAPAPVKCLNLKLVFHGRASKRHSFVQVLTDTDNSMSLVYEATFCYLWIKNYNYIHILSFW